MRMNLASVSDGEIPFRRAITAGMAKNNQARPKEKNTWPED
jgi:hypothetical protein